MSPSCVIQTCKNKSRAICHCCSYNFCIEHLKEHHDVPNAQLNYFVNEINTLADQILVLDTEITDKCHQKLDKWRDDCHMMIDRYYEEKYQQLQQTYIQRVEKYRKEIDQIKEKLKNLFHEGEATFEDIPVLKATINNIKRDIKQFEEKGITVDVYPLRIKKNMVQIEKWTSDKVDLSSPFSPIRTIDCFNEDWPVMTSNNQYLLMDQYPNLHLFDKELTLVKQFPWKYDRIPDMCWSSTLNSFIIITDKDGVFLVNEDITLVEPIKIIEKENWLSCTCSDASLFITTNKWGSDIFQFNLLSSFNLIKRWKAPKSCGESGIIHNIAYNNGTLAILSKNCDYTLQLELRCSTTMHRLWSRPLGLILNSERVYRVCLLRCDEWLVIGYQTSSIIHISKDGKLKITRKCDRAPQNAVLFGSNILAIRTTNCVNFHRL